MSLFSSVSNVTIIPADKASFDVDNFNPPNNKPYHCRFYNWFIVDNKNCWGAVVAVITHVVIVIALAIFAALLIIALAKAHPPLAVEVGLRVAIGCLFSYGIPKMWSVFGNSLANKVYALEKI